MLFFAAKPTKDNKLSQIAHGFTENPAISEFNLNPIMAFEDKVVAVDARITI